MDIRRSVAGNRPAGENIEAGARSDIARNLGIRSSAHKEKLSLAGAAVVLIERRRGSRLLAVAVEGVFVRRP
ncbi:MAG: hypothetical protein KDN05_25185, partial [Verrucomicrobiae bacterium]|nr:hypothetical protein [Verrucomicrobiae bacterium]